MNQIVKFPVAAAECSRAQSTAKAIELIKRYPRLSEPELAQLIELYRHLPALEVALLISDETTGPKLDRFVDDHRTKVRTPFRQYAVLVAIAFVGMAVLAWAVAVGS